MIIKGNAAGSVRFWSQHLLRDDTNETAEVKEIRGLMACDLRSALKEMEAIAAQSRCRGDFMYQANINPREGEHLTPEQWMEAVDRLERNLGLIGHQRVVVEHVKGGRQHYHIVWNRVDVDTLKVTDMGGNWRIHMDTARELEALFGLEPVKPPKRAKGSSTGRSTSYEQWEARAAERGGTTLKAMTAELTTLWKATSTGTEFAAAITARGYILAKGDRRDFCVLDAGGTAHSLIRRLDGVTTAELRTRMADIDRDALPSVAEARAMQRGRRSAPSRRGQPNEARLNKNVHDSLARRRFRAASRMTTRRRTPRKISTGQVGNRARSMTAHSTTRSAFRPAAMVAVARNSPANRVPLPRQPSPLLRQIPRVNPQGPKRLSFRAPLSVGSSMSEAQRVDLQAAIAGRITWAQYHAKWGSPSPS